MFHSCAGLGSIRMIVCKLQFQDVFITDLKKCDSENSCSQFPDKI